LVQILEVAFERRMCCSRACNVSANPILPSASTVWPTMRPGHLSHVRLLAGDESEVRTAARQRHAERLAFADAISQPCAPHAPAAAASAADTGLITPMAKRLCACAQSVSLCTGSSAPKKFGCAMTSAANG
jgi:hypothetical protein